MKLFVTGIGTDVGKTVVSAVLVEALQADYWKPVQAGNLDFTDTDQVRELVSNNKSQFHPESYRLKTPASPHHAASIDDVQIELEKFKLPETGNHLIIEGAGGALVPLNDKVLIIDLIKYFDTPVVLVSKNYLGSINHTLLTIEALKSREIDILGVIFNGEENRSTEEAILHFGDVKCLGRIGEETVITKSIISSYADRFNVSSLKFKV